MEALKKFGVPDETITVLKKLHNKVTYVLKVGNKKVKIKGKNGVKGIILDRSFSYT